MILPHPPLKPPKKEEDIQLEEFARGIGLLTPALNEMGRRMQDLLEAIQKLNAI